MHAPDDLVSDYDALVGQPKTKQKVITRFQARGRLALEGPSQAVAAGMWRRAPAAVSSAAAMWRAGAIPCYGSPRPSTPSNPQEIVIPQEMLGGRASPMHPGTPAGAPAGPPAGPPAGLPPAAERVGAAAPAGAPSGPQGALQAGPGGFTFKPQAPPAHAAPGAATSAPPAAAPGASTPGAVAAAERSATEALLGRLHLAGPQPGAEPASGGADAASATAAADEGDRSDAASRHDASYPPRPPERHTGTIPKATNAVRRLHFEQPCVNGSDSYRKSFICP